MDAVFTTPATVCPVVAFGMDAASSSEGGATAGACASGGVAGLGVDPGAAGGGTGSLIMSRGASLVPLHALDLRWAAPPVELECFTAGSLAVSSNTTSCNSVEATAAARDCTAVRTLAGPPLTGTASIAPRCPRIILNAVTDCGLAVDGWRAREVVPRTSRARVERALASVRGSSSSSSPSSSSMRPTAAVSIAVAVSADRTGTPLTLRSACPTLRPSVPIAAATEAAPGVS
mmetsp:Transcript_1247/g.4081  ORF Transcript_1247/g.4081 Transcript_1247/m.4081 type:complete len:232 (-) Transcript_1247:1469-2164(-)